MIQRSIRISRLAFVLASVALASVALSSCASTQPPGFPVTPREPGVRAPMTADCDPQGEIHCLLPWPSSSFLVADPDTATGVRLEVSATSLDPDDVANVWGADGFSRATSGVAGLGGPTDVTELGGPTGGVLRLFVATPGHPRYGQEEPLRIETMFEYRGGPRSLVIGDPLTLLEPGTDYVAIVTDALRAEDGTALEAPRATRVALGVLAPASEEEATLAGYHAPTVALLEEAGVDPARVLRAWDFTTRSAEDPRRLLLAVRDALLEALERGEVRFEIDEVSHRADGPIATIVRGHMTGLPNFVDASSELMLVASGGPGGGGVDGSPAPVVIPRGTGDYRTVMFGHGAGGSADDGSFDDALAEEGAAKVGFELTGWNGDLLFDTILALSDAVLRGGRRAIAPLLQAIAQTVVIERALYGALGGALSADMLGGEPNPHAGRRPGLDGVAWVGGSLGGITGLVATSINPNIHQAVLNVPACGWTQWVRDSLFYLISAVGIRRNNGGDIGAQIALSVLATEIDAIDGTSFVEMARENGDVLLIQESMGDEVVPNQGSELMAIVAGATMVGQPLSPIHGVEVAPGEVRGRSAITQFRAETDDLGAVHGFATNADRSSGQAAMEQIQDFLSSAWDGEAVIHVPSQCPGARCDFRE